MATRVTLAVDRGKDAAGSTISVEPHVASQLIATGRARAASSGTKNKAEKDADEVSQAVLEKSEEAAAYATTAFTATTTYEATVSDATAADKPAASAKTA